MNHFYLSSAHQTTPPPRFIHHLLPNCFPSLVALSRYLKTVTLFLLFPSVCSFTVSSIFDLSHMHTHTHTHFLIDLNSQAVYLAGRKKMWVKDKSPWNPQNATQKKTEQSVALALFLPPLILTLISPSCPPPVSPPHPISHSQHFRCLLGLHDMSADVMDGNRLHDEKDAWTDGWLTHTCYCHQRMLKNDDDDANLHKNRK